MSVTEADLTHQVEEVIAGITPSVELGKVFVTMCDTCNELCINPTIDHSWDENDQYIGGFICKECSHA